MKYLHSLFPFLLLSTFTVSADTIHHRLSVDVDPATHSLTAVDLVTLPASPGAEKVNFLLNAHLKPISLSPGVTIQLEQENVAGSEVGMDFEEYDRSTAVKLNSYGVTFPKKPIGEVTFAMKYSGVIDYELEPLGDDYARGFSQTPGIITDQGVYLAGSTFWVPRFKAPWISFDLTATMTPPWTVVSQGTRTMNALVNGKQMVQWSSPEPMKEVYLIAAPFTEYRRSAGAIELMAFLRKPEEALANRYLETTAQYLDMYRKLIGPYPFTKFALVENFWETGYGMPSFTLLGEQIIRFPFILHSSYPHELLHNYWGNSVYVDFKTGNWCEGLTAYLADHLVAEQHGQGKEYRRTTLQKFSDYVTPANDFPLSQFLSRTSPATEAIGYGKSLMLWNMLREKVGDERFVRSLQKFYRDNRFKVASYAAIRLAFESVSGQDLKPFFEQWVERTGAPELQIAAVSVSADSGQYRVKFTLTQRQADAPFIIDVPMAIAYDNGIEVKTVTMTQKEQTFELPCAAKPLLIEVDPQFQLFRKLDDRERPPALSTLFGSTAPLIVLPSTAAPARLASYRELAAKWAADGSKSIGVVLDTDLKTLPADRSVWVLGSENEFAALVKQSLTSYDAELTHDAIRFGTASFSLRSTSAIVAVRHPANPAAVVVLVTVDNPAAVAGLARKLPHYGKYSYLAFEGNEPTNTAKGEWPVVDSPLRVALVSPPPTMATHLPPRPALAMLPPALSSERMMNTIAYLASDELAGRDLGTPGLEKAADYILERFKQAGLAPGADDGSYVQVWNEVVDAQE
ncbi:MAG: M1 family aminopeptidase [Candidatus Competibacteraceae bacterium]